MVSTSGFGRAMSGIVQSGGEWVVAGSQEHQVQRQLQTWKQARSSEQHSEQERSSKRPSCAEKSNSFSSQAICDAKKKPRACGCAPQHNLSPRPLEKPTTELRV